MSADEALFEAENLLRQWDALYPSRDVLTTAMRGMTHYRLPWFDAQIWAIAEVHGLDELLSEDFQHGRHYGRVRAVNPFLEASGVHELPALYAPTRTRD
jgi:predicted nucleic acid-binding protein